MSTVAFIGLGRMGSGMASRLLAAGHRVHVYNRTRSRADSLVAADATMHPSPKEAAAANVDAVISMVADDPASRDVWLGEQGAFAANLRAGTLIIECSTLSHDWVLELASEAQRRHLRYIDSPVTGLPDHAAAGELTLLVGADPADLQAAEPVLKPLSKQIIHFGSVGAGTVYKLMINMLGAIQIASVAEGMALAERAGLNLQTVAEALAGGQAASPQAVRTANRIVADDHDRNILFTPKLRLKDVGYALQLATKMGVNTPFGSVAQQTYEQACQLGLGSINETGVIAAARKRSR